MNRIHKQRLCYVMLFVIGLSLASSLILYALKQNINVFLTPAQIITMHPATDYHLRLGGMVKKKSVVHDAKGLSVYFVVTDFKQEVPVRYQGILPDLFREGKGVVADGYLDSQGTFHATQVLAKHDENYMPKKMETSNATIMR